MIEFYFMSLYFSNKIVYSSGIINIEMLKAVYWLFLFLLFLYEEKI